MIFIIVVNSKADYFDSDLPQFIYDKLSYLLSVYDCDSLIDFGGIIIAESQTDIDNYYSAEITEKIIREKSVVWHATVTKNNSLCFEIYVDDCFLSAEVRAEWESLSTRTIFEEELYY